MTTITQARKGYIDLISPITKLRLSLEPPEFRMGPHGSQIEVPGSRKQLRFQEGKFRMPAEWLPILEQRPEFSGEGGKQRIVFLADTPEGATYANVHGVQVTTGPMTSHTGGRVPAPTARWDEVGLTQIEADVKAGRAGDVHAAIAYELTQGRRRVEVLNFLYDHARSGLTRQSDSTSADPDPAAQAAALVVEQAGERRAVVSDTEGTVP